MLRYLLDTNVLSEPNRARPDPHVTRWIRQLKRAEAALSTITFGEIQKGIVQLQPGSKRTFLARWMKELPREYRGRVLPVTVPVAQAWGEFEADARRTGRALDVPDGHLLATASVHKLVLVTRNERDCHERGVKILNPWNPQ
jgi:predicted nucleic acid-binding protein